MDLRSKSYCSKERFPGYSWCHYQTEAAGEAAVDAALKSPPAHKETRQSYGFPKRIGSEGDCFAKCKHVPWYTITPPRYQKDKWRREMLSCQTAHALGCKADGGQKTGYIDFCKGSGCKTNKWRTCACSRWGSHGGPKKKNGSCTIWTVIR